MAFVLMAIAFVHHVRRLREDRSLLIVCAAAPLIVFFGVLSFVHQVNENWPAVMYVGLLLGGTVYWAPRWRRRRARAWLVTGFAVGGVMNVALLWSGAVVPTVQGISRAAEAAGLEFRIDPERLPHARLLGWRQMARFAADKAKLMDKPHFIMARRADEASLLAFYLPGRPWTFIIGALPSVAP